jgi:energy-coupling factor transport system ATP-binding protein
MSAVWRQAAASLSAAALLIAAALTVLNFDGFKAFISGGDLAMRVASGAEVWKYMGIMLGFAAGVCGMALSLTRKRNTDPELIAAPPARKLSKRTAAAAGMILLAIPFTIYIGSYFFGDRKYYFISLLIILETMLPFVLVFESRKPQARELMVIVVLCGITVAGRAAFFMLPQFKPVVALVIISGVAFGGETGFLVGAAGGFISNFFFGQGPWTPWQMFAFGIIGFLAGVLFSKGWLRRRTVPLAIFGALATFVIYGLLMDTSMVLMYQPQPVRAMFLLSYLQGLPFNLIHAAATFTFLMVSARPMLEKLNRIKIKYGLVE